MEVLYRAVENFFIGFATVIYRHPVSSLLLVTALTLALGTQLSGLRLDTSNESFFHEDSPSLREYKQFREQFGREDMVIIATESDAIFDDDFLVQLQALHDALEKQVPYLDEVTSLLNARNTRGEADELIVEDLFENWPTDAASMAALEHRARTNPIYRDMLLSADGRVTALLVRASPYAPVSVEDDVLSGFEVEAAPGAQADEREFLSDKQSAEFVAAILDVVAQFQSPQFPLRVSGMPAMTEVVKQLMRKDMSRFVLGAVVSISLLLLLMFRRLSGIVLPILSVTFTLVCTLGMMALMGIAFKVPTQILPSFLIAVGVGSSVHILSQFYWRYDESGDRCEAIIGAMGHSGAPVVGAAVTTALGLMSFSNASLAPLAEMGIFAGVGVLISLIYTLVMIPALLALVPVRRRVPTQQSGTRMDRILDAVADYAIKRRKQNILLASGVTLLALVGLTQLTFEHDPLTWFPSDHWLRKDTLALNESLNGVVTLEVVIDTGRENGLYEPAILQSIDSLAGEIQQIDYRGMSSKKTLSLVEVVKEINLALHADQAEHYAIPDSPDLVAQELFLFENTGSDDLEDIVDSQFRLARYTVKVPWHGSTIIDGYREQLRERVASILPASVSVSTTGISGLFAEISTQSLVSMQQSYLIAAVAISLLMVMFIGDLKVGLIAMIPNLSPILIALGVLGWSGVPMNVFTMFVGSIALGLAVDDTLHFLHGFKRYHMQTGNTAQAIRLTFRSTGRALLVTSVALSLGFFIFAFATMQSVMLFGLLTGFTIILALVADFIVMPAMLMWLFPDHEKAAVAVTEEAVL